MNRRALITAVLFWPLWSCKRRGPERGDDDGTLERFPLEGVVIRVDQESAVVTIKQGPITKANGELWMEAMTMDFPVARRDEMTKVTRGRAIKATVVTRNSDFEYWIERIQSN